MHQYPKCTSCPHSVTKHDLQGCTAWEIDEKGSISIAVEEAIMEWLKR